MRARLWHNMRRYFSRVLCCGFSLDPEIRLRHQETAQPHASAVRWFRAPGARLSWAMSEILEKHGYVHVLGDSYANDPWVSDPDFLAATLLDQATHGSILIIH